MTTATVLALLAGTPCALAQVLTPTAQGNAQAGFAVAGVRDVNGDGRGDAIVGAPFEDRSGVANAGRVYLYGRGGALLRVIDPPTLQKSGQFGAAVAGLDNVNGDAFGDVLVGAPNQRFGFNLSGDGPGRAYVFAGNTGALIRTASSPNEQPTSDFGYAVAAVPDVNGDGRTDYVVSAPGELIPASPTPVGLPVRPTSGRVYLFSGHSGALLQTFLSPAAPEIGLPIIPIRFSNPPPPPFTSMSDDLNFGWSIAGVPDVTGDGRGDVLIGAPYEDPTSSSPEDCGRAYLFNGATGGLVKVFASPTPTRDGHFGYSVGWAPDANQDGRPELVIGSPGDGVPARSGRVYMYSGATGVWMRTFVSPNRENSGRFGSAVSSLSGGFALTGSVAISAPHETVNGLDRAGRVYTFDTRSGVLVRTHVSPNVEAGGQFGRALSGMIGPGVGSHGPARGDILVGAPYEDPGSAPVNSGRALIVRN